MTVASHGKKFRFRDLDRRRRGAEVFNDLTTALNCRCDARLTKGCLAHTLKKASPCTNTHESSRIYMSADMQEHTGKCKKRQSMKAPTNSQTHSK